MLIEPGAINKENHLNKELLVDRSPRTINLFGPGGKLDPSRCNVFLGHLADDAAKTIQSCSQLVIRFNSETESLWDIGSRKHFILAPRKINPMIACLKIIGLSFQLRVG